MMLRVLLFLAMLLLVILVYLKANSNKEPPYRVTETPTPRNAEKELRHIAKEDEGPNYKRPFQSKRVCHDTWEYIRLEQLDERADHQALKKIAHDMNQVVEPERFFGATAPGASAVAGVLILVPFRAKQHRKNFTIVRVGPDGNSGFFEDRFTRVLPALTRSIRITILDNQTYRSVTSLTRIVFFLHVYDNDFFQHYIRFRRGHPLLRLQDQIIARHSELYFLSWNPTVLDPLRGRIGPRTIPIPDMYDCDCNSPSCKRHVADHLLSKRKRQLQWRGVTTGMFPEPNLSDRAKAVATFRDVDWADVKFGPDAGGNWVVQGVMLEPWQVAPGGGKVDPAMLLLDVDGNANAWLGLRWKLKFGVVVKVNPLRYIQWYYPLLREGVHLLQFSPFDSKSQILKKCEQWLFNTSEEKLQKIADAGAQFHSKHLKSCQQMEAYLTDVAFQGDIVDKYAVMGTDWRIQGSHDSIAVPFHKNRECAFDVTGAGWGLLPVGCRSDVDLLISDEFNSSGVRK